MCSLNGEEINVEECIVACIGTASDQFNPI